MKKKEIKLTYVNEQGERVSVFDNQPFAEGTPGVVKHKMIDGVDHYFDEKASVWKVYRDEGDEANRNMGYITTSYTDADKEADKVLSKVLDEDRKKPFLDQRNNPVKAVIDNFYEAFEDDINELFRTSSTGIFLTGLSMACNALRTASNGEDDGIDFLQEIRSKIKEETDKRTSTFSSISRINKSVGISLLKDIDLMILQFSDKKNQQIILDIVELSEPKVPEVKTPEAARKMPQKRVSKEYEKFIDIFRKEEYYKEFLPLLAKKPDGEFVLNDSGEWIAGFKANVSWAAAWLDALEFHKIIEGDIESSEKARLLIAHFPNFDMYKGKGNTFDKPNKEYRTFKEYFIKEMRKKLLK
ncbi:hypothetical protein [Larkinella sp.]|uniref:hypothetical protein n=1 Tax=Larkinella sp. TaxID=2034517 RepID=UPI003BAA9E1B